MVPAAAQALNPWSSFYTITGSSAAALTGLMFVVITLVTGSGRSRKDDDGISTFSTPTVLHFCTALLISVSLSAPWRALLQPAIFVGIVGFYGVVHIVRIMLKTSRLSTYKADLSDWVCYTVLPFVAYGAMVGGAIALPIFPRHALFAVAGAVVLLIFIGIRNAWDIVTFIAIGGPEQAPDSNDNDQAG